MSHSILSLFRSSKILDSVVSIVVKKICQRIKSIISSFNFVFELFFKPCIQAFQDKIEIGIYKTG